MTLGSFIKTVYAPYAETHHRSRSTTDHLKAWTALNNRKLSQLTVKIVKSVRTKRLREGVAPATLNRNLGALKTALNHAVEEGYLESNPLVGLSGLKVENPNRVRYLLANEETRLRDALEAREQRLREGRTSGNTWRAERGYPLMPDLSNIPFADHLKPMVLLTINTGLRRGELFNLKWKDIVEDAISVTRSKSGQGRHIPLNSEARQIIEGWRATGTKRWVFESDGAAFDNVNKAWRKLLMDARIADFRWHDLRHHFASKLVVASVPLNTVRELLGHSDLQMTLRYAHLAPGHMREAVEAISP